MVIALLWRHMYTLCHTLLGSQSRLCSLMQSIYYLTLHLSTLLNILQLNLSNLGGF